jgi:sigma-B regulation protein RsbU (phosphoserine phosphatase)
MEMIPSNFPPATRPLSRPTGAAARRILVVDDDAAERARLAALLEARGLEVACVADGDAGRRAAFEFQPDIVISDWCMPGLDGPQLCRALREDARGRKTYIILVTGRGGDDDLVAGLEAGADDFVTKPYRASELLARVDAGRRLVLRNDAQERGAAQERGTVPAEGDLRRGDLAMAAALQARQIPGRIALGGPVETGCLFRPAADLAGDTFGYRMLPDARFAFYLADVAGHGVPAALNAFALGRLLRNADAASDVLCARGRTRLPRDVLATLNASFAADEHCDQYFTMVYGVLDPATGHGTLCQAGHPHPLLVAPDGQVQALGSGGFPVGLVSEATYEDVPFKLAAGHRLVLVSDGVLDHRDPAGRAFASHRLESLLRKNRGVAMPQLLDNLEDALDRWSGEQPREDDISLLCLGIPT